MTGEIRLLHGDITQVTVDAIVNAANSSLMGGGGVDGAIHRKGGPAILEACRQIIARQGRCAPGEAVITTAGSLPASFIIHTVGPVWQGGNKGEEQMLTGCYRNSLQLALDHQLKTIAFPNISTGIFGYPKEEAAVTAIEAVRIFLHGLTGPMEVSFVCFDEENYSIYKRLLA